DSDRSFLVPFLREFEILSSCVGTRSPRSGTEAPKEASSILTGEEANHDSGRNDRRSLRLSDRNPFRFDRCDRRILHDWTGRTSNRISQPSSIVLVDWW